MTHREGRALRALLDAIDNNVERRVLLDKHDGERRTETVVKMTDIHTEYSRARQANRSRSSA